MNVVLVALALAQPATELPRYTATPIQVPARTFPSGINRSGDYTFVGGLRENCGVSISDRFSSFPTWPDNPQSYIKSAFDINDRGAFVLQKSGTGIDSDTLVVAHGAASREIPTRLSIVSNHGYLNNAGDFAFNAFIPGLSGTAFGYRLSGSQITRLDPAGQDAIGGFVIGQSETGEIAGHVLIGRIVNNSTRVTRTRAAIWTRDGRVIRLPELPHTKNSSATAVHSPKLVAGHCVLQNGAVIGVLWVNGELKDMTSDGVVMGDAVFAPDGRVIAVRNHKSGPVLETLVGSQWHAIAELTSSLPTGTTLRLVKDVATDGTLLVDATSGRQSRFFKLTPAK